MDAPLAPERLQARLAALVAVASFAIPAGAVNAAPSTPAAPSVVTGVATYLDRSALPPTARFEATVEDVTRADAPARVIGATSRAAGQVPIRFQVPIEAGAVEPNHRYSVRARILVDGRLLYTSDRITPVLTNGAGTHVELRLRRITEGVGVRAPPPETPVPPPDRGIENTYWKLTSLRGQPASAARIAREAHLLLHPQDARATGSGGCNQFTGAYTLKGETLRFGRTASTMMACPDGMAQERDYFAALEQVRRWRVRGETLELLDERGVPVLAFQAVDLR